MARETQQEKSTDKILAQIEAMEESGEKRLVKTRSLKGKVKSEYVGHTLGLFDGSRYRRVHITQEMVGKPFKKLTPRFEGVTARHRFLSIPPKKMRLVADMVKGLPVEKALDILNFSPRIASHHLAKTLKSAAANLLSQEGTSDLNPEDLKVKNIVVDPAATQYRARFQSMGRVFRIRKRFCHLTVELEHTAKQVLPASKPTKGRGKTASSKAAPKKTKASAGKGTTAKKKSESAGPAKKAKKETKTSTTSKPKKTVKKTTASKASDK